MLSSQVRNDKVRAVFLRVAPGPPGRYANLRAPLCVPPDRIPRVIALAHARMRAAPKVWTNCGMRWQAKATAVAWLTWLSPKSSRMDQPLAARFA